MVTRQQWAMLVVAGVLAWVAYLVLGPFLPAIAWAAILALVSWPLYQKVYEILDKRSIYAALAMTLLVSLSVILPVVLIAASLASDAVELYRTVQADGSMSLAALKESYAALGRTVARVPVVGGQLQNWLREVDLVQVQQWLRSGAGRILTWLAGFGQAISGALVTLGLTIFTLFFLYLSGLDLVRQTREALEKLGGEPLVSLLDPLGATVRAVVLGLVLTGAAQGLLAGLGLWVAGIEIALILGVLAALLSILQIPTPVVWFPCVIWLAANGQTWQAVALFLWGALVVGTIDNFLKPLFISQGTGIPILLVFFGVLGGLLAFGTIGIVVGPVSLALLLVLWRRWTAPPETVPNAAGQTPLPTIKEKQT
ncbi:glr2759 [Gloeobacter violaceus PCC 7421]|uniref:Glr2759 protein n=1 Tax=Gloeobacter violaceus (strain ATCC 29082 / PCC 7421) TaxID=251221 RepID=Q7NGX8_GLOVI|nr:glr2759 [Gloeobacter violaceus PCC 7421]